MGILETTGLLYEPKKENRWIINLPERFNISKWVAYATQRPVYKLTGSQYTWEPIEIKFRDPISESTTVKLWELFILQKPILHFDYTLEMIDPVGEVVERWEITGCKILKVDFGKLDYSSELNANCTILVQPTNVKLLF